MLCTSLLICQRRACVYKAHICTMSAFTTPLGHSSGPTHLLALPTTINHHPTAINHHPTVLNHHNHHNRQVAIRLLGIAISCALTAQTVSYLVAEGQTHGGRHVSQLVRTLWPSTLLAPLSVIASLAALPVLLYCPAAWARHHAVFDHLSYCLLLVTRVTSLLVEPASRARVPVVLHPPSTFM